MAIPCWVYVTNGKGNLKYKTNGLKLTMSVMDMKGQRRLLNENGRQAKPSGAIRPRGCLPIGGNIAENIAPVGCGWQFPRWIKGWSQTGVAPG